MSAIGKRAAAGSTVASHVSLVLGKKKFGLLLEPWDSTFTVSPVDWKPVGSFLPFVAGILDRTRWVDDVMNQVRPASLGDLGPRETLASNMQLVSMLSNPLWELEFA